QAPHFLGVGLHDGLADRHLAVAADRDHAALADRQNGSSVPGRGLRGLHGSRNPVEGQYVRPETTRRNSQRHHGAFIIRHRPIRENRMSSSMRGMVAGFVATLVLSALLLVKNTMELVPPPMAC